MGRCLVAIAADVPRVRVYFHRCFHHLDGWVLLPRSEALGGTRADCTNYRSEVMRKLVCKCGRAISHDCLICDGYVSATNILPNGKYHSITFACRFCGEKFTVTVAEMKGSISRNQTCNQCGSTGTCQIHLALASNGWLPSIDWVAKS